MTHDINDTIHSEVVNAMPRGVGWRLYCEGGRRLMRRGILGSGFIARSGGQRLMRRGILGSGFIARSGGRWLMSRGVLAGGLFRGMLGGELYSEGCWVAAYMPRDNNENII